MNKWIDEHMQWIVLLVFAVVVILVAYYVFTSIPWSSFDSTNITSKDLIA